MNHDAKINKYILKTCQQDIYIDGGERTLKNSNPIFKFT